MIPRGPALLHGTLRLCAEDGSSRFFPRRACLVRQHLDPESRVLEDRDNRVNRHICENFHVHKNYLTVYLRPNHVCLDGLQHQFSTNIMLYLKLNEIPNAISVTAVQSNNCAHFFYLDPNVEM